MSPADPYQFIRIGVLSCALMLAVVIVRVALAGGSAWLSSL